MKLSKREARTLLAALRCWQNEMSYHCVEETLQYFSDFDVKKADPLNYDEVCALLRRVKAEAR